jgi:signal transduction histidine kinase
MSDKVKFLMSFRARLMLVLSSFLLLTIILVVGLDSWARKRADQEVARQSQEVGEAVNTGFGDFATAIGMAIKNLSSDKFLYERIKAGEMRLPGTIKHIIISDKNGLVNDTTTEKSKDKIIRVPKEEVIQSESGDPCRGEDEPQRDDENITTYIPFTSARGLFWIVIVTKPDSITDKIDDASHTLTRKSQQLSNIRLLSTTGLLAIALLVAVIIGWRFTSPIQKLASAARSVAAGNLDFRVGINRQDEVGQLASTFNEMIAGLKSKRELEERLNQAERSAVIGRLTQAVAHEIRNPLNVINLSIDHASKKYAPEDETRRKQFTRLLSSIKDEIERLKRLVNDLLNYGRPTRLAVETVDMGRLMEETLALVRPQADVQEVEVMVEADSVAAEVRGDRERLKSVISNLAINALQAMPTGGHLNARIARVDGSVEVSIADTGVGISQEALGKIFEPYFSTKQTGFGLGLAVTKWIIQEHRGTIDVESEVNRGTTFTVKLPAAE